MKLREHPLMTYRRLPNWPPVWTWMSGGDNKHPRGEVGILRRVEIDAFSILITKTHHTSGAFYADHVFCSQIVRILDCNLNKTVAQIGSLDISRLL